MWYYICVSFILMGGIIVSRLNSAYHHELIFKHHINVKNTDLQKLLIWQSDPFGGHHDNKKAYRGKMTIHGICFYVVWLLLLMFSVVFLIWGPKKQIEPIEFNEFLICTTLNKATVVLLGMIFICFSFAFYSLNIMCCRDVKTNKIVMVLWWLVVITFWLMSIVAVVEFIKLF